MKKYALCLVDIKTLGTKTFSYLIPDDMKDKINIGIPVLVPFGKSREIKAYVVGFSDYLEEGIKAKYMEAKNKYYIYVYRTFRKIRKFL